MTMENSGHEETNSAADKGQPPVAAAVPNPSRRRFTRAGVGASAVVMTLASRSVLANMACTTASGFHSANMSHQGRPGDAPIMCDGLSYREWMATADWNPPKTFSFQQAFGCVPRPDLIAGAPVTGTGITDTGNGSSTLLLQDATLQQAMFGSQTPLVVKHLIAALLNASSGKSTYPTLQSVKDIFADWNVNNTYQVSAGVKWTTEDIIEYLSYTQTKGAPTFPPKRT
jgi:hypothetical protein